MSRHTHACAHTHIHTHTHAHTHTHTHARAALQSRDMALEMGLRDDVTGSCAEASKYFFYDSVG